MRRLLALACFALLSACSDPALQTSAASAEDSYPDVPPGAYQTNFRGIMLGVPEAQFEARVRSLGLEILPGIPAEEVVCTTFPEPGIPGHRIVHPSDPNRTLAWYFPIDGIVRQAIFTKTFFNADELSNAEFITQAIREYGLEGQVYYVYTTPSSFVGHGTNGLRVRIAENPYCRSGEFRLAANWVQQGTF